MSYILDALKKSDQERSQGNVPDLKTVHMPVSLEAGPARWPYIVIVLLMLSLAFVLGMFRPWDPVSSRQVESSLAAKVESSEVLSTPEVKEPINAEQSVSMIDAPVEKPVTEQIINKPVHVESASYIETPTLDLDSVPHLYEMPSLVQQAIPEMSFAGHVFSSDINQRTVIINGHSMSEGEVVIQGLKVEQITHNGIVFDYDGQLFRMDVLQDWSFD